MIKADTMEAKIVGFEENRRTGISKGRHRSVNLEEFNSLNEEIEREFCENPCIGIT